MGEALLRQPDGLYTIWSTVTDSIVAFDLTADEYRERAHEEAALTAARTAQQSLDRADAHGTSSRTGRTFQATVTQARLTQARRAQARRAHPDDPDAESDAEYDTALTEWLTHQTP